jgi:hypothetical protein
LATALLAGAVLGTQQTAVAVAQGWALHSEKVRVAATALVPRGGLRDVPAPAIVDDAAGTFLGMSDDLLLARVREQPIVKVKWNRGGSSLSFRVEFADGSRAAFKPAQTNLQTIPRKEVAAYRLNRLLGLNAVPPAAPRMVSREEIFNHLDQTSQDLVARIQAETIFNPLGRTDGVIMYWVPQIKESGLDTPEGIEKGTQWLMQGVLVPGTERSLAAQLSSQIVFDFLTSNPDRRSGGNMKMSPDGDRLYTMDNTMSFFLDAEGSDKTRTYLEQTQRFSRRLFHALERVTVPEVKRALAGESERPDQILTDSEVRAVVSRRRFAQRHIAQMIGSYGETRVLAFP